MYTKHKGIKQKVWGSEKSVVNGKGKTFKNKCGSENCRVNGETNMLLITTVGEHTINAI